MKDSADPLEGWSSEEVADTSSGPASADIYGKLFYYLHGQLRSFLDRLSSLKISLKILQIDISSLPDHIDNATLSRIEVCHRTLLVLGLESVQFSNDSNLFPTKGLTRNKAQNRTLMTQDRFQMSPIQAGSEYIVRFA